MQCLPPLLALLVVPACAAGSLKHIHSIPLSDYIRPAGPFVSGTVRVTALAFSPDERWLAATVNVSGSARLLVLAAERRPEALRYSGRVAPVVVRPGGFGRIVWSPDGKSLAIGSNPPLVLDVDAERACEMSASPAKEVLLGGFTSSSDIAVAELSQGRWRIAIYTTSCKAVHYRDLEAPVVSIDASQRGRIAASTADGRIALYDATTGSPVKNWGRPKRTQVQFLAHGEMLCEAGPPTRDKNQPECWSVTDESMAATPEVAGGAPFSPATEAAVAAFTDGKYSYDTFFETGRQGVRRGVVWNFGSGKIIAKWDPDEEPCEARGDLWSDCRKPATFAVSPQGGYLAEAKAGQLRIYRIVE